MDDPSNSNLAPQSLLGRTVDASDPAKMRQAIEAAFHYRGDVTIIQKSTGQVMEGFIFDRFIDKSTNEPMIRMIPKGGDDRLVIPLSDIASLAFTGKDTASGKSFENWVKKYAQKKLAGQPANIESEPLQEDKRA
jgi:hypothetical protein